MGSMPAPISDGGAADGTAPPDDRAGAHYFSPRPGAAARPRTVRLTLPDLTVELGTDSGVFSPDRIDPGTQLLLADLPAPGPGPVVDLGCGYGPIATTVAARHRGHRVIAVDVNDRARELCRANARRLGVDLEVLAPDELDPSTEIGTLVSNPPIRIGKAALHDLLTTWLSRLAVGGTAHLVVNKNLGADSLARWLAELGWSVRRRHSRRGYRVLELRRDDASGGLSRSAPDRPSGADDREAG